MLKNVSAKVNEIAIQTHWLTFAASHGTMLQVEMSYIVKGFFENYVFNIGH